MPSQKLIKKHMFSKPHKISTNSTMGAQWLNFGHFLGPFGHPFFIKFRDRPNLLNCNKHGVKTLLLPLQASHFGIENPLTNYGFSRHHFFLILFASMSKNEILGSLQNPVGAKMAPKINQVVPNVGKQDGRALLGRIPETSSHPRDTKAPQGLILNDF